MPPKLKAVTKPEFPPEVCGVCKYCEIDKDGALCWVEPPEIIDKEQDGSPIYGRGSPLDPHWRACRFFSPVHHA